VIKEWLNESNITLSSEADIGNELTALGSSGGESAAPVERVQHASGVDPFRE
jgi:hypothetical protein